MTEHLRLPRHPREHHAEIDEVAMVASLLAGRSGASVMFDVGAHHGVVMRPFVSAGWQVVAFEPDAANRRRLLAEHAGHPAVFIDGRAVTDRVWDAAPFYVSAESSGISALCAFHDSHRSAGLVPTTTVAAASRERGVDRIDFLKIDAEGEDLLVLRGVDWDLSPPGVIQCEFEDYKTLQRGYRFPDIAEYLVDRGYRLWVSEWYPVQRYGIRHDWRRLVPYPCELEDDRAWGNILAFRDAPSLTELAAAAEESLRTHPDDSPQSSGDGR